MAWCQLEKCRYYTLQVIYEHSLFLRYVTRQTPSICVQYPNYVTYYSVQSPQHNYTVNSQEWTH